MHEHFLANALGLAFCRYFSYDLILFFGCYHRSYIKKRYYVANYVGVRQITHVITCKTCFVNHLRNYAVKLRRNLPSYALANYVRNYVQNAQNPRNLRNLRDIFFNILEVSMVNCNIEASPKHLYDKPATYSPLST